MLLPIFNGTVQVQDLIFRVIFRSTMIGTFLLGTWQIHLSRSCTQHVLFLRGQHTAPSPLLERQIHTSLKFVHLVSNPIPIRFPDRLYRMTTFKLLRFILSTRTMKSPVCLLTSKARSPGLGHGIHRGSLHEERNHHDQIRPGRSHLDRTRPVRHAVRRLLALHVRRGSFPVRWYVLGQPSHGVSCKEKYGEQVGGIGTFKFRPRNMLSFKTRACATRCGSVNSTYAYLPYD